MGFLSDVMTEQRPASADNETQARQRARRRLIGAGVLLAVGVIGFPLLFETTPRPVPADVPAVQASRERPVAAASPSKVVERATTMAPAASAAASVPSTPLERASDARREIPIPSPAPTDAPRVAQEKEKVERERADKTRAERLRLETERAEKERAEKDRLERERGQRESARKESAEQPKAERAAREPKATSSSSSTPATTSTTSTTSTTTGSGRFVVQVGAYASDSGVREVRNRLERVGLKSHTQVVRGSSGTPTTRVRTGPYASRQEAEKAAAKARSIGLTPSIVPVASTPR